MKAGVAVFTFLKKAMYIRVIPKRLIPKRKYEQKIKKIFEFLVIQIDMIVIGIEIKRVCAK